MPGSCRLWAVVGMAVFAVAASSCAPLVIGGAAVGTGAVAATEHRGMSGFASDLAIQTEINDLWFKHSMGMHNRIDMTIDQGRVLLTGWAKDAQERLDAVRLAWQAKGVKEVINEIQVDTTSGIGTSTRDTWITTQLRSVLTFDKSISSQNYSITTVSGVVYLLGTAKSRDELDRVIDHARSLNGVQRVVNHVRVL